MTITTNPPDDIPLDRAAGRPAAPHRLNAPTVSFYAWLVKLSQRYGYCWASNEYLACLQGRSESQIGRRIAALVAAGWLRREMVGKERRLFPQVIPPAKTPRRSQGTVRRRVPLRLVPVSGSLEAVPQNAYPGGTKRVPRRDKTRTPAGQNAYPLIDASDEAPRDEATDNGPAFTDAPTATQEAGVVADMVGIGVWPRTARKIALTVPAEEIKRVLRAPERRSATDPAAWFVAVVGTGYRERRPSAGPPATFTASRRVVVPPPVTDPGEQSRLEAARLAHPGLTGRGLAREMFRELTRNRPATVGPAPADAEPQERPGPEGRNRHSAETPAADYGEDPGEREALELRWARMQDRFTALAAQEKAGGNSRLHP